MIEITYFVHGTTTDNEKKLATGWLPGELSELGIHRVSRLRDIISNRQFDMVFCSDLKRAVESAKIAFPKNQIIQDKRLRECHYGVFDGKPKEFKKDMMKFIDTPFQDGECYRDVEKRMAEFLEYVRGFGARQVAIVAHEAPQLALDVLIKKKTWEQAIAEDWRRTGDWQPGWKYVLE